MAKSEFAGLQKRINGILSEFDGKALEDRLKLAGKRLEPHVEEAVMADIGDTSMSGWPRRRPMALTGHAELATSVKHGIFIAPGTVFNSDLPTQVAKATTGGNSCKAPLYFF